MSRSLSIPGRKSVAVQEPYEPQPRYGPRRRLSFKVLGALLFVLMPTLLATVYYGYWATDRYVSQAKLTLKSSSGDSSAQIGSMLSGIVGDGGASQSESYVVVEYMLSEQIVGKLQGWLDLRQNWSSEKIDRLSSLDPNASLTRLHEYYTSMVTANYIADKGVIHLNVQGYTAEDANALATAIITLSEDLVNRMSENIREDSVSFAKQEVERAEERLQNSRLAVKRFQNEHGQLDPEARATAIGGIMTELESRLAKVRAEITAKGTYMRDNSARMEALRAEKQALEQQLARERERLAGDKPAASSGEEPYSDLLARYEELKIREEFARQAYQMAQNTLESARMEAAKKQLYLVDFVEPSMPDQATKPDRVRKILIVLVGSVLVLTILTLVIGAIREHAKF